MRRRIDAGQIRPLLSIAAWTTPGKIREVVVRQMLRCRDVIDMERRLVFILRQLTVFAAIARPDDHLRACGRVDHVKPPLNVV